MIYVVIIVNYIRYFQSGLYFCVKLALLVNVPDGVRAQSISASLGPKSGFNAVEAFVTVARSIG